MITGKQNICAAAVFSFSLAIAALILFSSGHPGQTGFPLDDAWIHLVYGRSVAQSGYLAFNTGIPSTGSTSPLWAYMLGLVHAVFRKTALVIWAIKILGAFLHAAMAFLSFRLVLAMTSSAWGALFAGLFLGSSPALVSASLSGMEISLGCLLCLAGILCFLKERWGLSGFLMGLAGLTRPEFAAVIIVLAGDMLIRITKKQIGAAAIVRFSWPIILLAGLYIGWDLAVDGRPFPATYYAKAIPRGGMDTSVRLAVGLGIITGSAPLGYGILVLGLLSLLLTETPARRLSLLFLGAGIFYLAGNLALIPPFDPDAFYHIRYLLPSVPLLFTGVVTGLASGTKVLSQTIDKTKKRTRIPIQVLLHLAIGLVSILMIRWTLLGLNSWTVKYSRDCRNINEVQVELGQATSRGLSPDARVGTIDAGAVRYFGGRFTVDLMGLNTPDFAGGDCQSQALDVLVLMPAWIRLPSQHNLVPVFVRQTADYRVTSNPQMNRQLIAVCASNSPLRKQPLRFQILGKVRDVCLRCLSPVEADEIKRSLAAE